ncbi:dTDP-4-amino-4,6-dideoxygalactose transaminase [Catenulispora sp. GP43]|uniref:DegT/DnrJ/EryC1/StrS family aminotransferase n=1 Tax=Catenulispora sp. GP43 TaxID=3156263 RepID=UPI00351723FB
MIAFHSNSRQHAALAPEFERALRGFDLADDDAAARAMAAFETSLASYAGVGHAVGVASGTDAVTIALNCFSLPPGGEVITCDFGFYATAAAIVRAGFQPVFVDTAPDSYLMDPARVAEAITPQTVAIVAVHLFGEALPLTPLADLAREHGIALIEDCAQALGARDGDRPVGTVGAASAVSFNWTKHLGSQSNAGAVLTNDAQLAEMALALRSYGSTGGFRHDWLGLNSRINPFEALILDVKLPHLDGWIDRRAALAARYDRNFDGSPVGVPFSHAPGRHAHHKYTIRVADRDGLHAHLLERGVTTMACYPYLLHEHGAFDHHPHRAEPAPNAAALTGSVLALPVFPELTDDEIDGISELILGYVKEHS